jgi:hypothetical protein
MVYLDEVSDAMRATLNSHAISFADSLNEQIVNNALQD